jgi:D-serine deaminase-like pyridoxal phosphate-dependent protein
MGYEAHLIGKKAELQDPVVQKVLRKYRQFVDYTKDNYPELMNEALTFNSAGTNTYNIYADDDTMNDLGIGSGVVQPIEFDSYHVQDHTPASFIAAPVLKKYEGYRVPEDDPKNPNLDPFDPNRGLTYFIYGGFWKASYVSPTGIPKPHYHSSNQEIINTSKSVDLNVDDYVFLRPHQSEQVMLQFGDLMVVSKGKIIDTWPVFS